MIIHNFGHSCFLCKDENGSFVFDPYKDESVPGISCPKIYCDVCFISHSHDDHNAIENVFDLKNNPLIECDVLLTAHDKENGNKRGFNKIHKVKYKNFVISHLGDLGQNITDDIIDFLKGSDVIFCPINGFYTIGYKEAIDIFNRVKPSIFIPMHYYKNGTGYIDDNQIDKFKQNILEYEKIYGDEIDLSTYLDNKSKILIFERS